jgi:hypothetical protein
MKGRIGMSKKRVVVGSIVEFRNDSFENHCGLGVVVGILTTAKGTVFVVGCIDDHAHAPDLVSISTIWADEEDVTIHEG